MSSPFFDPALLQVFDTEILQDGIEKVVVGAVVLRNLRVLLLKRLATEEFGGLVELPSGTVEANEPLDIALAREVLEETALPVTSIGRYLGSFDYVSGSGKRTRQYNFSVYVEDGDVKISHLEHEAYYWVDTSGSQLDTLKVSDETKRVIRAALS